LKFVAVPCLEYDEVYLMFVWKMVLKADVKQVLSQLQQQVVVLQSKLHAMVSKNYFSFGQTE
jgi:hypothetical protein